MWWFNWHVRRFFRSVMNPMDPDFAVKWHRRFRFAYVLCGVTAFSVALKHQIINAEKERQSNIQPVRDETPAHRKARLMQLGDVHIIRSGIGIPTKTYDINSEEYSKEFNQKLEAQKALNN